MQTHLTTRATRRWRTLAVAAALTAAALMGGCGPDSATPVASASPSKLSPKDALLASIPTEKSGSFHFTLKADGGTGDGVIDPATKALSLNTEFKGDASAPFSMSMAIRVIDTKAWVRMKITGMDNVPGFGDIPDKWLLIDQTKIKDAKGSKLAFDGPDVAGAAELFKLIVDVKETGEGKYAGTVDLSTVGDESELFLSEEIKALGDQAKSVPFEATLDSAGRLSSLTINMPAVGGTPASTTAVTFDSYGSAAAITEPAAAEVQAAPTSVYDILNGG